MHFGAATVATGTAPTALNPNPVITIPVSADGSDDAAGANKTYVINPGSYTYNISHFHAGDVLDFPATNILSVSNPSFTDSTVDITYSTSLAVSMTVHLTGLNQLQDAGLNGVTDFATMFGPNTII
jgi:hypothetical protein